MRIYVAGKWEEKERVREVMAQLVAAGHAITHDWTQEPDASCEQDLTDHAEWDVGGVLEADAFVGVFEKKLPYSGAATELGMAIACDIPIYIMGNGMDNNVFVHLPKIQKGLEGLLSGRAVSN